MKLIFEQIIVGGDRNFGYLIGDKDAGVAALIDPSYNPEIIIERATEQKLAVEYIFNTHGHGDHINGNEKAKVLTGAQIAAYHNSNIEPDLGLEDGQEVAIGGLTLRVYYTPGHCTDHIVIYCPEFQIAFTGDHLFVGKIGGTLNEDAAKEQWDSLLRLYAKLPETATIWPGHNFGCRPSSTLAIEKSSNPFLTVLNFESFLEMKNSWPLYKVEQGLI